MQFLSKILQVFKHEAPRDLSPLALQYLREASTGIDRNLPLALAEFVVLDLETTGLDTRTDKILSIGAVLVKCNQIDVSKRVELTIRQSGVGTTDAVQVHQMTRNMIQRGMEEQDAIGQLITFIGARPIVGHHIGFDFTMLSQAAKQHYGIKLSNKTIDTETLAKRVYDFNVTYGNTAHYSLDDLLKKFNIPVADRHTAPGDAFMTALVFLKLLAKLEKRGVRKLKEM